MSAPKGRSPLQALADFVVRKWYTQELLNLAEKVRQTFWHRNEVMSGGVVSIGATVTASAVGITTTALVPMLNGRIKAAVGAQTNQDIFTTAGVFVKAIYANGADASGISLATDETAYFAVICLNSDGAGGVDEADNGTAKLLAVVNGTATTYMTQTAPPTSSQIAAALAASSSLHEATTGWVWLASVFWDENSASPTATATLNRNNVISEL